MTRAKQIVVRGAREHNLQGIDLDLERGRLIVVSGVSGSGKSSLAFDTLYREGQRRYLETFPAYARQHLGKLTRPAVDHISGLSPAISVDQKTVIRSPRSTVGTMSELYSFLRLLYARLGSSAGLSSSLFSFNSPIGACPTCNGLGVEDQVDPTSLVGDPTKTVRDGALVLTTPNGYLVYSQVTMEVLNQVCGAHGFSVDIAWEKLTDEQRHVILYGSDKIKIPFGKHPLESRLKWSGITAKPREEGYYKGIVPVIAEILKHKRNKNVLRFVRSLPCNTCKGTRLCQEALRVTFRDQNIAVLANKTIDELEQFVAELELTEREAAIGGSLLEQIQVRTTLLRRLGLGYLTLARESTTLSGGEAQRIRLVTQVTTGLVGLLYVLDEPSVGLHPRDNHRLLEVLRKLRDAGNTVVVVEHDEETIKSAEWLVDIGPGAGVAGGTLTYSGPLNTIEGKQSPTLAFLTQERTRAPTSLRSHALGLKGEERILPGPRREGTGLLTVFGARARNLKNLDVSFRLGALNVVTGVSGAGKSTLVLETLARALRGEDAGAHDRIEGDVAKVIEVDQSPIGRTPRSNAATYTKLWDHVRALFAQQKEAEELGFDRGRFSFNVSGGRCEACQGAGVRSIGMHYLADVEVQCEQCGGRRFNEETLAVRYRGKNVAEILMLSVEEAKPFFQDQPKIHRVLEAMVNVGLGYLSLGQPATTLSGGEAQRVKLSAELARASKKTTLYVLDEPTTGLHRADVRLLLATLQRLVDQGHTVIVVEHDLDVIRVADWVVDLGPEGGSAGGQLLISGTPEEVARCAASHTGRALNEKKEKPPAIWDPLPTKPLAVRDATVHNLDHVDVTIPPAALTVITGVSGSGKSSLAFDTIVSEGQRRFSESLSTYARRFMKRAKRPAVESITGLSPVIAIDRGRAARNPRSTVGTLTEIYDDYRLLFARSGQCDSPGLALTARLFSFNHQGACETCRGLGEVVRPAPDLLVTNPELPLTNGALAGHKTGRFYGDPEGQHVAILRAVGAALKCDYDQPWSALSAEAQRVAMEGTADRVYDVTWHYRRKEREGEHQWRTTWDGFLHYVQEEYERKHADRRAEALMPLMRPALCPDCDGERLRPELRAVRFRASASDISIGELANKTVCETLRFFEAIEPDPVNAQLVARIQSRLTALDQLGLGYLSIARASSSLSGGELQRVRLASTLAGSLCGVTYVLDEPTVSLHARDTEKLIGAMRRLCALGNTVIVVEHDPEVVRAADHVIDLGPGAGKEGGEVLVAGTVDQVLAHPSSVTGQCLKASHQVSSAGRELSTGLTIAGARAHNLRGFDLNLPANGLIAMTGVSGSGKSTLLFDVVLASIEAGRATGCDSFNGRERFGRVLAMNEKDFASGAYSTPATVIGIYDRIRTLFAKTATAKERKWGKARFSLATKGGRCEACRGTGELQVEMGFLADVVLTCEECSGLRFAPDTLEVCHEELNIAEVLALTVSEARGLFAKDKKIVLGLQILEEVGLSYLSLGQRTSTLSGGEQMRLKLAAELCQKKDDASLLIFDEPTTGLHLADVAQILAVFDRLVSAGNTVLVIEHHLDVIRRADWVVDLGPGGGDEGGQVLFAGRPEDLAKEQTPTGKALNGSRL